jgi:hypothetical protein
VLIAKDGLDETFIEVTIERGGKPYKTWRWQLKMKGKKVKVVALGEVYNHEAEQASVTPQPLTPTTNAVAVENRPNVSTAWTALAANDFYPSTYTVVPTANTLESA